MSSSNFNYFQHLKWEKAEKILVFIKLKQIIMKDENRNDLISFENTF